MQKRARNDDVRQFIDLEAIEHGDSESEEDADPDLDDFILPDSEFPVTSGHGSSEARLRDESADELRELAESFKEHQRQNRDSEDDSQSFGQIYQVAVQRGYEEEVRRRLLQIGMGVCDVQHRPYLPGRLWVVTTAPQDIQRALYKCNVTRRAFYVAEAWSDNLLGWDNGSWPKAGQWARAKRGKYRGDLAFVLSNSAMSDIVQVAMVPRMGPRPLPESLGKKRKKSGDQKVKAVRHNAAVFDSDGVGMYETLKKFKRYGAPSVQSFHENDERKTPHEGEIPEEFRFQYQKDTYIGGLLVKNVCGSGYCTELSPGKDEMVPFVESRIRPDIILPKFVSVHWKEGDKTTVTAAPFYGITGTVVGVDHGTQTAIVHLDLELRTINPSSSDQDVHIPIDNLRRRFTEGDAIRVLAGKDRGKHGIVITIEYDPAYVSFLEKDSLIPIRVPADYIECHKTAQSYHRVESTQASANTPLTYDFVKGDRIVADRGTYASNEGVIAEIPGGDHVFVSFDKYPKEKVAIPFRLLKKLPRSTSSMKHPLLNKYVFVISKVPEKGLLGEIRDASGTDGKLQVKTALGLNRFARNELAIAKEDNTWGSTLDSKTDEDLLREVRLYDRHSRAVERILEIPRARTPELDPLITGDAPILDSFSTGDDAQPEASEPPSQMFAPIQEELSFLLDNELWRSIASRQIHVRFKATYDGGRWINRIGITCPTISTGVRGFTGIGGFALKMTNKKSQVVTDIVSVKHLLPAPPAKKGLECVPLTGNHRSALAKVLKINKTTNTASLESFLYADPKGARLTEKWEENLDNLCWVEQPSS